MRINLAFGCPTVKPMRIFCIVVKGGAAAWSASRWQCRDGGAGAGARHEAAARAARPTSFCLAAEPLYGTPGGGTFWFQIFIQASSPEIWSETIFGGEEVLARKWGGLFMGYLLGKNFRRRTSSAASPANLMHLVCSFQSLVTQGKSEYAGSVPSRAWPERVKADIGPSRGAEGS